MSRIGKQPVVDPGGREGEHRPRRQRSRSKARKGKLQFTAPPDHQGRRRRGWQSRSPSSGRTTRSASIGRCTALTRALVNNLITGVSKGYEKRLKSRGRRVPGPARQEQGRRADRRVCQQASCSVRRTRRDQITKWPSPTRRRFVVKAARTSRRSASSPRKIRASKQAGAVQGQGRPVRERRRSAARKASPSPAAVDWNAWRAEPRKRPGSVSLTTHSASSSTRGRRQDMDQQKLKHARQLRRRKHVRQKVRGTVRASASHGVSQFEAHSGADHRRSQRRHARRGQQPDERCQRRVAVWRQCRRGQGHRQEDRRSRQSEGHFASVF